VLKNLQTGNQIKMTPEEAQLTGQAYQILENELSSVKIISKVEMKSGKRHTEWEVKCKHEDPKKAKGAAIEIDKDLRDRYGQRN